MTKTAEDYELALFRRLGALDLYRQLTEIARAALMDDNRCALAGAIASLLSNFRVEEDVIQKFLTSQIDKEEDCNVCFTRCKINQSNTTN